MNKESHEETRGTTDRDQRASIIHYFSTDNEYDADSLLCIAASLGQLNLVRDLVLSIGANVNAEDKLRRTPLILTFLTYRHCIRYLSDPKRCRAPERLNKHATISVQKTTTVIEEQNFEANREVIHKSFKIFLDPKNDETTVTFHFNYSFNEGQVAISAFEECVLFLIQNGADMNVTDEAENTPLILASDLGLDCIVKVILKNKQKCNIYYSNIYCETALHKAADSHHFKIIELLTDAGASFSSKTNNFYDGNTPLECLIRNVHKVSKNMSESSERRDLILGIIQRKREDYSTVEELWELVSKSIYHDDQQTLQILLNIGFPLDFVSNKNDTALGMAVKNNKESIIELLLSHGTNPNNKNNGHELLSNAIVNKSFDIVKILIVYGTRSGNNISNNLNKKWNSLLCLSLKSGCFDTADILFKSGHISLGDCQTLLRETGENMAYRKWLLKSLCQPLTLRCLARKTVLHSLRQNPNQRKALEQLYIPKSVKSFLELGDITSQRQGSKYHN